MNHDSWLHLKIYGEKMLIALRTICGFAYQDILLFSAETRKRLDTTQIWPNVGFLTLGFDDEVLLKSWFIQEYLEDDRIELINCATEVIDDLKKVFKVKEPLYSLSVEDSSLSNEDALDWKKFSTLDDWVWLRREPVPITIKDMKTMLGELKHPTGKNQITDPFIIEKRRNQLHELYRLTDSLELLDDVVALWLQCDKADEASYRELAVELKLPCQDVVESKMFDDLVRLVAQMRDEADWIDPIWLFKYKNKYKELV